MSDEQKQKLERLQAAETRREKLRGIKNKAHAAFNAASEVFTAAMLAESDATDDVFAARAALGLKNERHAVAVANVPPEADTF